MLHVCVYVYFFKAVHTVQSLNWAHVAFAVLLLSFPIAFPSLPHSTTGGPGSCQSFGRQGHLGKIGENGTATGQPPGELGAAVKFKTKLPPCSHFCNMYPPQTSFTLWGCSTSQCVSAHYQCCHLSCAGSGDGLPENQELWEADLPLSDHRQHWKTKEDDEDW